MLDCYDIAEKLQLTAKLMELHDGNPFKIKALANGAFRLSKMHIAPEDFTEEKIAQQEGIGKSISKTIIEIAHKGTSIELVNLLDNTPSGVVEMLAVKGIGPKKVKQLWKELDIESPGDLLYACYENRLIDLKGFGQKTQQSIKESVEFMQATGGKAHYAAVEESAAGFVEELKELQGVSNISLTGDIYRKNETLKGIDILIAADEVFEHEFKSPLPVNLIFTTEEEFYYELVKTSSAPEHLEKINFNSLTDKNLISEEDIYKSLKQPYFIAEWRDGLFDKEIKAKYPEHLIEEKDLKGILHNHSTYSDGANTLAEMANYCKELGYEYFGIADHSKSATYANGLKEDRIFEQQKEIDVLNEKFNTQHSKFRILKGTECDILYDGSLDYADEVLATFDYVVVSIHQHFKMDEEKATARLLKAIENPYTTILGHPTGRLLLGRPGYPINHKKIIDACAANNVVIELNAHPYRLDIDWRWIPYCMEQGVKISINPDAHEKQGFHDMHFGVCVARKGLLTKDFCFNALDAEEMKRFLTLKK
jgi:DNA polymerase (family 10)